MGRLSPFVAITGFAVLGLTTACSQSPVQPSAQSPINPAPPDTVTPLATVSRTDLGTLGGARSFATDVNDSGIVVGWSQNAAGVDRAFRWTAAQGMTDLGTLPGDQSSRAVSITNEGEILGVSGTSGTIPMPVVWDPSGNVTSLPIPLLPGATGISPADYNELGEVIGNDYGGAMTNSRAWIWSESGGIYDIQADIPGTSETYGSESNGSGLVVGTYHAWVCVRSPECWHAFVWSRGTGYRDLGVIPGNDLTKAQVTGTGVNDLGIVVGWTSSVGPYAGSEQPFKWSDGTGFTILPTFCNCGSAASVNSAGTVVGISKAAATAWPAAGGIVTLNPDDSNVSVAVAINASGVVVGWSALDASGVPAIHATLWRLGPGRGADPPPVMTISQPSNVKRAMIGSQPVTPGPMGCLSEPRALISKQLLIDCVVQRLN